MFNKDQKIISSLLQSLALVGIYVLAYNIIRFLNSEEPSIISDDGRKILSNKTKRKELTDLIKKYNDEEQWDDEKLESILK